MTVERLTEYQRGYRHGYEAAEYDAAAERRATVERNEDALRALRTLFDILERLDGQAQVPSRDHFVKVTVEMWRDQITPLIRTVRRAILDEEAAR